MRFFIADLHDMDENTILYTHRPFDDAQAQHDAFVANWNEKISDDDEVFLLGDIGALGILEELNGKITIIIGNHDDYESVDAFVREHGLQDRIYVSKHAAFIEPVILSHEPITFLPPELPYLNIHGHLHGMEYGKQGTWADGRRFFNVAADNIGFVPISEQEIMQRLAY